MRKGVYRVLSLVPSLLMLCCCIRIEGVNGARIFFAEDDVRGSEDKETSKPVITVQVEGEDAGNFTAVVTPLTVAQFQAQRDEYGMICDTIMKKFEDTDTAEDEDFSALPVEVSVPDHATHSLGRHQFTVEITLTNDNIQEPTEYFLVILEVKNKRPNDSIGIDPQRQCSGVVITEDKDDFGVVFEPVVTDTREDDGEVELFKIVKMGQTEQVVKVALWSPGSGNAFAFSESIITLQPNELSATVNITVTDDNLPEDDKEFTITGDTNQKYGQYRNHILRVTFTIHDNDNATIGFNASAVTVIEGESVILTTVFKDNLTIGDFHRYESFFSVHTEQGSGNATAPEHYTTTSMPGYHPGNIIVIATTDDDKLERSRQFEVILEDPSSNPLNLLSPGRVLVTIRDNDGTPSQPRLGATTFTEGSITLSWTIERHELRPVGGYDITIESIRVRSLSAPSDRRTARSSPTRVNRQAADGQDRRIETHEYTVTKANCKLDPSSGIDHCLHTVDQNVETGTAYNVIMCAGNEFASVCDESGFAIPVIITAATRGPAGLEGDTSSRDDGGLPTTTILWIVIGVLASLLLCCSVLACLSLCSAIYALQRRENKEIDEEDSKRTSRARPASSDSSSSTEAI